MTLTRLTCTIKLMDKLRGQHQQISRILNAVQDIPQFKPFDVELPDQNTLKPFITQLKGIHVDLTHFDDKGLKDVAKNTSNRKLSKEDTDYLQVVLEAITVFESATQLHDKHRLNLHLTQLRLNWIDQHKRYLELLKIFSFNNSNDSLSIAVDILTLSSSAVDEMIELIKVPDSFLDEQDKLENSLTQLISLIQTHKSLIHHLFLDSWLQLESNPHPFADLGAFEYIISSATNYTALHSEIYNLVELLQQVRQQSSAMIHLSNEFHRLLVLSPSHDALSAFQQLVQQIKILSNQSSPLIAQINTKVQKDAKEFLSQLNSMYRCYFKIADIRDRAFSTLDDSNTIAQLPSLELHSSLVEVLDQLQCDTQPSKDLMNESRQTLDRMLVLSQLRKKIDDGDHLLSQMLNAVDEQKQIDDLRSSFENIIKDIQNSQDKRVLRHIGRLRTTCEEVVEMTMDDDCNSSSQPSNRLRSSSIESSSSAFSGLSLVDYNSPRARKLSSSSTHKKLFDATHDGDIPPVPAIPNMKDWSKSSLNLPGPSPRKAKPTLDAQAHDTTPTRKHDLTKATRSSISRRTNRAVSTPMPHKTQSDASPSQKRILSTSTSASSLKTPAPTPTTPSKGNGSGSGRKKSWSSSHSTRSPRPSFKVAYRANPKSKLDLAVGKVVNSLPLSVNIERAVMAATDVKKSYETGKYWIGAPDPKLCFCRILRSNTVMVRVGGGWEELSKYLLTHYANLFMSTSTSTWTSTPPDAVVTPAKNRKTNTLFSPASENSPTPSPYMSPWRI
ncbi:hypothetical protein E3P77_00664 [Wallemia ichthyophaga]|nr:hypothetical protein E3P77_00664 [Wallemia ichthyophaga]